MDETGLYVLRDGSYYVSSVAGGSRANRGGPTWCESIYNAGILSFSDATEGCAALHSAGWEGVSVECAVCAPSDPRTYAMACLNCGAERPAREAFRGQR